MPKLTPTLNNSHSRPRVAALPIFTLYGETGPTGVDKVHVETIQSRSTQYDWEIDAHVHPGLHQVIWLRSGRVEAQLDESRSSSTGPVALMMPPGVAHAFRFSPGSDGHVLTFDASLLTEGDVEHAGEALARLFAQPRVLPFDSASPDVERLCLLFDALAAESSSADGAGSPVPSWLARSVIWRLAQAAGQDDARPAGQRQGRRALFTRWQVLLEAHYLEHWPVSRYASKLGLSPERLNRMVRAETGLAAQALLHARLSREACRRLVHVAAPVSKLAFELGFDDPAYFCRFFKRHTGQSPQAYRSRFHARP